jgi:hypothetical protein
MTPPDSPSDSTRPVHRPHQGPLVLAALAGVVLSGCSVFNLPVTPGAIRVPVALDGAEVVIDRDPTIVQLDRSGKATVVYELPRGGAIRFEPENGILVEGVVTDIKVNSPSPRNTKGAGFTTELAPVPPGVVSCAPDPKPEQGSAVYRVACSFSIPEVASLRGQRGPDGSVTILYTIRLRDFSKNRDIGAPIVRDPPWVVRPPN